MIPIYTQEEFNIAKSNTLLPLKCEHCGKTFYQLKKHLKYWIITKGIKEYFKYCSQQCEALSNKESLTIKCTNCNKNFTIKNSQNKRSKSGNHFCSQSCAAIYNNTHKTKGIRRSKLEQYLEYKLNELYPQLEILFNDKTTINSELDIYIPSLKLAFELNGIFHYEPIFGESKLNSIQQNDANKFQKCQEHGISLCIIDTSSQKYFKEQSSIKFLNIIKNIIDGYHSN